MLVSVKQLIWLNKVNLIQDMKIPNAFERDNCTFCSPARFTHHNSELSCFELCCVVLYCIVFDCKKLNLFFTIRVTY